MSTACDATCKRPARSQAHCTVCHLTFVDVHGFGAHRRGGWCLDPATIGLVELDEVWRTDVDAGHRTPLRGAVRAVEPRT